MKIAFFFRKPSESFHSIEEQFFAFQKKLPEKLGYINFFAKFHSKGLIKRILITIQAAFNQGDINHITGDIHFVALFLKKKKTILTVHDIGSTLKTSGFKKIILRFFWFTMPFIRVQYITVISEFTKNEILDEFNINPDKIIVIPDCISEAIEYSPKEFISYKPVILQIGTKTNKNITRLIEAVSDIECKLIIVGKLSKNQTQMLNYFQIDYENYFNLEYSEIVDLYKRSDIVSFISTYEGFGVPILEAQGTGRPVITSNISPMKEVAGAGALIVNPYDVLELREGVLKIISDSDYRKVIINKGLENVKKYSAKFIAEQYTKLYQKILYENNI